MKEMVALLISVGLSCLLQAQKLPKSSIVYMNAASLTLIGQAFPLNSFHRIDTAEYPGFPPAVKRLLTHASGLAVCFNTNSPRIAAKWCVTSSRQGNNMTAIVNKGLDLYIKLNGKWVFAGVGRPAAECNESVIVQNMDNSEKECLLYLPLYDEIKSLSVGVDSGNRITPGKDPFTKMRVLVYGSSITQGASASRPGMAYPARLSRKTGIQFLNLGLSGNGKMEKEVADMVAEVRADAFVLDCFANPSPEQITERTAYLVKKIREKHPHAPIIMIQSVIREAGNFDTVIRKMVSRQNENTLKEYRKLQQEGIKDLYLIPGDDLLGKDHEGTTDGSHPNDMGFDRMLEVIRPEIMHILQPGAQSADEAPIKLRVATYNVGHFNQGMRGGLEVRGKNYYPADKVVTGKYIQQELLRWKSWIGAQSFDIFGVQEWNRYFDQDSTFIAAAELLKPYYNNVHFGDEHTWIYNGIATNYHLSNLRQKYWFKDYYALIGDLKIGNKTVQIISTHIPWQKEGHAPALDSVIAELKKYEYFICFLDTNSSDAEILRFQQTGCNIANGGSQGWFATAAGSFKPERMNDGPNKHIDNIITSKNIKIMNVSTSYTGLNDMDHLPLMADVIITDNK